MSEPTREELVDLINRVIENAEAKLAKLQNASALVDKLIELSENLIHGEGLGDDDYLALCTEWKEAMLAEWKEAMLAEWKEAMLESGIEVDG